MPLKQHKKYGTLHKISSSVFLDIYLKDWLGIDIARKIRETDREVYLVFCTSSNGFASESYEVNARDYLLNSSLVIYYIVP